MGDWQTSPEDSLNKERDELLDLLLDAEGFDDSVLPVIRPRQENKPAQLSYAQQRLWFLDRLEPGNPAYNIPSALRLSGRLNQKALEESLNEVVARHDVLRASFPEQDGRAIQVIAPILRLVLPMHDLSAFASVEQNHLVAELITEEVAHPFNLASGPLIRSQLIKLGEEEHVLLVNLHHIASDGWSLGILVQEIARLYVAFSKGQPSPLSPLPLQYADYADWQREQLSREMLAQQLAYWKKQLGGHAPVLQLPTDRPRPSVQSYRGGSLPFSFSARLLGSLKTVAQSEQASLFMVLLAAFQLLLFRYSGQMDISIGTPIAGRTRPEWESLIGMFVNTLVIRTNLAGNPTFRELLRRVRGTVLDAYAAQDLPFEQLVGELQPDRDMSRNPLFQVMFALQNTPASRAELPGLMIQPVAFENRSSQFDLRVSLGESADGLDGGFEYATDLFDSTTVARLIVHYHTLLEAVIEKPDQSIGTLALMPPDEYRLLVETWNQTNASYPQDRGLHEWIEDQVRRTPSAPALVFEGQTLSYRELNRRANLLAGKLREAGIGPERRVGVCMERSIEMVTSLLAVLKAGGAFVPIDPTYPKDRLAYLLNDYASTSQGEGPILLTQPHLRSHLPDFPGQSICLEPGWGADNPKEPGDLPRVVTPDNLAYVIYTSGSTGRPKGAMNSHRAICNRLFWMQKAYALTSADRVLQKTPFSFDVSVWEFFWPLLNGACLVIAPPQAHRDSAALVRLIAREKITVLHFVPSMLRQFLEEPGLEELDSVRHVICSGEALGADLLPRYHARLKAALHNLYGPTEAAVDVTYWDCPSQGPVNVVPIGKPIDNLKIYLLDGALQPVPVGVPGEIHIGGVGLGRGYWNRPELTAEKFIPDRFSSVLGARLYKTGDLARYLPDGNIEYLGRLDYQVKIHGFRIELGEIETWLSQHPAVHQAVVLARQDLPGEHKLVAYLVSDLVIDRIPLKSSGQIRVGDSHTYEIKAEDISCSGVCISGAVPGLRVGQPVMVRLMGNSDEIWLEGKVAWIQPDLLGVKLDLTAEQRWQIQRRIEMALKAPEMSVSDLRRSELRVPMKTPCQIELPDGIVLTAVVENISLAGLGLRAANLGNILPGQPVRIHFQSPGAPDPTDLEGTVMWQLDGQAGVRLNPLPEQRAWLEQTVDYFVEAQGLSIGHLRQFLAERLPEYMIPSAYVFLDTLPLTPNGKVDRKALPAPELDRSRLEADYIAPGTPVEKKLAEIWTRLLGLEQVGIHDNFFEVGGDSILSLQVIARARQAGLRLTTRQIFQYQTIAQLANLVDTTPVVQAEQGLVTGTVSLTPILHWFFEQDLADLHYFNQAVLLEVPAETNPVWVEQVVWQLLLHHDMLRLRAIREESGWQIVLGGAPSTVPFVLADLSDLPSSIHSAAVEAKAAEVQAGLNLTTGPVMQVVLFRLGDELPGRLLIVIHHVAVDGVSWRFLLEDFQSAYQQLSRGESIHLPPKTTSYQCWAENLTCYARSKALHAEKAFWLDEARTRSTRLSTAEMIQSDANRIASARTLEISLTPQETNQVLKSIPETYHVQVNDVLMTALGLALFRQTGESRWLIDIEGHGREDIDKIVDVSRTVGWFTTIYPVFLEIDRAQEVGETLQKVKEQLRKIPNQGVGYGCLRYLSDEEGLRQKIAAQPQAEILFNYLGQFDQAVMPGLFSGAPESSGPIRSLRQKRRHALEINALVLGNCFRFGWIFSEAVYPAQLVEALAQGLLGALRDLIRQSQRPQADSYAPSDFSLTYLDQQENERG
ncbi:MAG: amino acid adenylation domain-containing protein [Chloroflexota bacterium]